MQFEHEEISLYFPCEGSHTSISYVFAAANPMSPLQRSILLYGKPSFSNMCSASSVIFSSSSNEFCGSQNFTSSTLLNWCWRIMPFMSFWYAPASLRKQGEYAQ